MAPHNNNTPTLEPSTSTHLELALVTNRCEEALYPTGDVLLTVAAHF